VNVDTRTKCVLASLSGRALDDLFDLEISFIRVFPMEQRRCEPDFVSHLELNS
jgi:hypothetical protein